MTDESFNGKVDDKEIDAMRVARRTEELLLLEEDLLAWLDVHGLNYYEAVGLLSAAISSLATYREFEE